jgi:tetratricopeptide (TPR) repeat protein
MADPAADRALGELKAVQRAIKEKRWTDALRHIDAAIAASPTSCTSEMHYIRGDVLDELHRYDEAIAALDRAIQLDARNVNALLTRSYIRSKQREWAAVLPDCNAALAIDPNCTSAFNNRSVARRRLRQFEGAIADARAAISRAGTSPLYHETLADALRDSGDFAGAIASYQRASELSTDPVHSKAYIDEIAACRKRQNKAIAQLSTCRVPCTEVRHAARVLSVVLRAECKRKGNDEPSKAAAAAKRAKAAAHVPVTEWDVLRVAEWVAGIAEPYGSDALAMQRRGVDGRTLLLLDDALLIDIGVADRLRRARLLAGLSLSPEQCAIFTPLPSSAPVASVASAAAVS